jgi:sensor c-di-GMP phosphodiesterase-like protein
MHRRDKLLIGFSLSAFAGTALLVAIGAWYLWNESIEAEEQAVAALAKTIGERTDRIIVDARTMLEKLNDQSAEPCSDAHLRAMDRLAFSTPQILAIGYWQGAERMCGAGFTQAIQLKPPVADRIYDSGVIAWWPGPHTEVEGVQLFLMRYRRYDVAMNPRSLLQATPTLGREVGLWVEGLRMAAVPWTADLPSPDTVAEGLSLDRDKGRLLAHFSLDTIFPIDIVVAEPIGTFWDRYLPTVTIAATAVMIMAGLWLYSVVQFMRRRLSIASELQESLSNGGITAYYQPIIDLVTGQCVGAEALARWTREDDEFVTPDTFLVVAEHAGLMRELTRAMLNATLSDLGFFLRREPAVRINLNLAPEDLEDDRFATELGLRMAQENVAAGSIKLEITERALVNSDTGRRVICTLREQGHEVAIDDFGTGYSSLSYLESFELDTLKIDKSFVDTIGTEAVTSHVIHHVIELAKSLDLSIVAEGIETEEQAKWLKSRGVRYGQGYLYSEPLSALEFEEFFGERRDAHICAGETPTEQVFRKTS